MSPAVSLPIARERPILFSEPMVRAILQETKTQTRRIAKIETRGDVTTIKILRGEHAGSFANLTDEHGIAWSPAGGDPLRPYPHPERCCPYGEPGDRLWVRETWKPYEWEEEDDEDGDDDGNSGLGVLFLAGHDFVPIGEGKEAGAAWGAVAKGDDSDRWRPSIHMPRWASRISLQITAVRIERLQSISEQDAQAEGVGSFGWPYRPTFASLWDRINGKRAPWAASPWVWAVSFARNGS